MLIFKLKKQMFDNQKEVGRIVPTSCTNNSGKTRKHRASEHNRCIRSLPCRVNMHTLIPFCC